MINRKRKVVILYHYMYPDDVVSASHFDGLADLAARVGKLKQCPVIEDAERGPKYSASEINRGSSTTDWRPKFRQSSFLGRLLNSLWMIIAWTKRVVLIKRNRPHIVIIGTDPVFGLIAAIPIKVLCPAVKIVHWCFDLHPEAAVASGIVSRKGVLNQIARAGMKAAYRRCDLIVDIGQCMRDLLRSYDHRADEVELTPWALIETSQPAKVDVAVRQRLFGDAKLAVLYSGNFGEAHSYDDILRLARVLRGDKHIHFCFAVRGNKVKELTSSIDDSDINISFADFASLQELEKRLGAADIHLTSLNPTWSGIAIPSKFFGSLAIGRPVLFSGPKRSAIDVWIQKFGIGWSLNSDNVLEIADDLRYLAANNESLAGLQQVAFETYQHSFSRGAITKKWNTQLSRLVGID